MSPQLPSVPANVASLGPFVRAGVFGPAELQLAATVDRLCGPLDPLVVLAVAVAARGPRLGHVCVDLREVERLIVEATEDRADLEWPTAEQWVGALVASPCVATPPDALAEPFRPLVLDGPRIYLQRFWEYETSVAAQLIRRSLTPGRAPESADALTDLEATLDTVFGVESATGVDRQRQAARVAMHNQVSVIAGGPGTGKTRTIARLLVVAEALAFGRGANVDIALAAPTGKAAARMTEAVAGELRAAVHDGVLSSGQAGALAGIDAMTLHRLLGWAPGTSFRHHRDRPLPHDVVVLDETSMVPLQLMARLLDALKPTARLVLVGDPFQLASVEAGSVLEDVVGPALVAPSNASADAPLSGRITVLDRMHRFAADSPIAALAGAVRQGDVDTALGLLASGADTVQWIRPDDREALRVLRQGVIDAAVDVVGAAEDGDAVRGLAAAKRVKVLAATRRGELGLYDWNDRIESAVAASVARFDRSSSFYVGRPIIVSANDYLNDVLNGDVGLVVRRDTQASVALVDGGEVRYLAPSRLDRVETWWAMTIHKSQGSEFAHAVVSLPNRPSPVLSRAALHGGDQGPRSPEHRVEQGHVGRGHRAPRGSGLGPR